MAVLVRRQESEAFPCSQLRGSFRITLLWDTAPPCVGEGKRGNHVGRLRRVSTCRFPLAQMRFSSGTPWSKSKWLSVGPCLDAWLYNFKWHSAADHSRNTHIRIQTQIETNTALCGEPIWEWKESSLEVLPSRGDCINRWKKGRQGGGFLKMEERMRLGTFTFVNFRCCLFLLKAVSEESLMPLYIFHRWLSCCKIISPDCDSG